ncbi:hypothetical protein J3459_011812 [Metarhizium acridum]|nr:hypothetical protein J3459_011812 [Metarhizium acridum]
MDAYVKLLIQTCHRRGVHAMGGMAAQIPIKDDKQANDAAMENVRADKLREVRAGHDGTWVAHPALASIATDVFNKHMPTPNQLFVRREDVHIGQNDLLNMNVPGSVHRGRHPQEPQHWPGLHGGLDPRRRLRAHQLPDDAATAEVSRSRSWQWGEARRLNRRGKRIDKAYALKLLKEQADHWPPRPARATSTTLPPSTLPAKSLSKTPPTFDNSGEDIHVEKSRLLYNEITQVGTPSPASKL